MAKQQKRDEMVFLEDILECIERIAPIIKEIEKNGMANQFFSG